MKVMGLNMRKHKDESQGYRAHNPHNRITSFSTTDSHTDNKEDHMKDTSQQAAQNAAKTVKKLEELGEPFEKTVRWKHALSLASQGDRQNPALVDIMDLVLLSIEDATASDPRISASEVRIQGRTVARFGFASIQMALIAKIALTWGPDGPAGRDDISSEDMELTMRAVFSRYRQDHVLAMSVEEYEAALTSDGMIPGCAERLSRLIVSTLALSREDATICRTKRLDQNSLN